jgi:hypothetical protein
LAEICSRVEKKGDGAFCGALDIVSRWCGHGLERATMLGVERVKTVGAS